MKHVLAAYTALGLMGSAYAGQPTYLGPNYAPNGQYIIRSPSISTVITPGGTYVTTPTITQRPWMGTTTVGPTVMPVTPYAPSYGAPAAPAPYVLAPYGQNVSAVPQAAAPATAMPQSKPERLYHDPNGALVSQADAATQFEHGQWLVQTCGKTITKPKIARECETFAFADYTHNPHHEIIAPLPVIAGADYEMLRLAQEQGVDDSKYMWYLETQVKRNVDHGKAAYCARYKVDCGPLDRMAFVKVP